MKNWIKTDFDEFYNQLDEIYTTDFNTTGSSGGIFYHFYEDLSDILNSLVNKTIYSSKNDSKENKAQFDANADDGEAYVCMTSTLDGKKYIINKYDRPFGLSFKEATLKALCDRYHYRFDPQTEFSAFGEKGNYTVSKHGRPQLLAQSEEYGNNPFSIYAIGELEPGKYFISGGQGVQHLWASQIFEDETLYLELKKWFLANMNSNNAYQRQMYYWFINGEIGEKTLDKNSGRTLLASGNLNQNYRPYIDKKGGTSSAIAFDFKGKYKDNFKEVIGYGPINLENNAGETLLKLGYQWDNASGGYRGPFVFGKNLDTNKFNDKIELKTGQQRKDSIQQHLFADEQLFKKLCKVFNEHETRIYIPDGRDMRFTAADIETIILPDIFKLPKYREFLNIRKLIKNLDKYKDINLDTLIADEIIIKPKKSLISKYMQDLVKYLIVLLAGNYSHIGIELVPDNEASKAINSKASLNSYLKDNETTDNIQSDSDIKTKDHARKVINSWPDISKSERVKGENGEWTVLAPIELYPGRPQKEMARIGSELILTAEDINGNKYVLFVPKAKSTTFMELPGGGFMDIPESLDEFKKLVIDKLSFKCNINESSIKDLTDTGKALILHEDGVAQSNEVRWDWSYYRLYTAKYIEKLTEDDLDYTYNNKERAKSLSTADRPVNGYKAFLRWLPIESLTINRAITDRYSNIIPMIKQN